MQGALESLEGVKKVNVSVKEKQAVVVYNSDKVSIEDFNKVVPEKAGAKFKVSEHSEAKLWIPASKEDKKTAVEEKLVYYTCPMKSHKHIHSGEPGKCPECNMELVKAVITSEQKAEFYGCPMKAHSHVRSDKPGKCDECGMTLKPMRLEKKM